MNTVAEPLTRPSGGPVQVATSPTCAAGKPPMSTVGAARTGDRPADVRDGSGERFGQVCMSVKPRGRLAHDESPGCLPFKIQFGRRDSFSHPLELRTGNCVGCPQQAFRGTNNDRSIRPDFSPSTSSSGVTSQPRKLRFRLHMRRLKPPARSLLRTNTTHIWFSVAWRPSANCSPLPTGSNAPVSASPSPANPIETTKSPHWPRNRSVPSAVACWRDTRV